MLSAKQNPLPKAVSCQVGFADPFWNSPSTIPSLSKRGENWSVIARGEFMLDLKRSFFSEATGYAVVVHCEAKIMAVVRFSRLCRKRTSPLSRFARHPLSWQERGPTRSDERSEAGG